MAPLIDFYVTNGYTSIHFASQKGGKSIVFHLNKSGNIDKLMWGKPLKITRAAFTKIWHILKAKLRVAFRFATYYILCTRLLPTRLPNTHISTTLEFRLRAESFVSKYQK